MFPVEHVADGCTPRTDPLACGGSKDLYSPDSRACEGGQPMLKILLLLDALPFLLMLSLKLLLMLQLLTLEQRIGLTRRGGLRRRR